VIDKVIVVVHIEHSRRKYRVIKTRASKVVERWQNEMTNKTASMILIQPR